MAFVRSSNHTVLAYVRVHESEIILCVANLSRAAQASELDLSQWKGREPFEMLGRTTFPDIGELPYLDYAWSVRLLLVFTQGETGLAQRCASHRSRFSNPRHSRRLDDRHVASHQGRVRTRRAAVLPGAVALVSRALRARHLDAGDRGRSAVVRSRSRARGWCCSRRSCMARPADTQCLCGSSGSGWIAAISIRRRLPPCGKALGKAR